MPLGNHTCRKLSTCFSDGCHGEWAGFYNQGYPASTQHRHMFWHVKYRKTTRPHQNHWYSDTDDQLMEECIARDKDEFQLQELEDIKNKIAYSCSDPRLHPRQQDHSEHAAEEMKGELKMTSLHCQKFLHSMWRSTKSCHIALSCNAYSIQISSRWHV